MNLAPYIRIILRYSSGFLVAKGFLDPETGMMLGEDAEVAAAIETAAGFVIGAASECWYAYSRKRGGAT